MKKEYYAKVIFDGSEDWKTCDNTNEINEIIIKVLQELLKEGENNV